MLNDLSSGPLGLFEFGGELQASLNAFVKIGFGPFSIEKSVNFATVTLLDFNSTSPPPDLATQNASTGIVTLNLTPANADTSGKTAGIDNFTIEDLGPDKKNGGEIIDVNALGQDQIFHGVTGIDAEGTDQPFDLNIQAGVTAPVDIAGGYYPNDPIAIPTTNTVEISDLGSGPATIYASDGDDDIHVGNAQATIYGGNDTTNGANPPKDDIELGAAPQNGGINYIYGGTALETLTGGAGNDYIDAGNSSVAFVEGGGGDDTMVGGDGEDHFVVDFADAEQLKIAADPSGNNSLEVDGAGGGESITAGVANDALVITSVDGSNTDSVTAKNIPSVDIEPAPGIDPTDLATSPPGANPATLPTPPSGTINVTVNNLNGSGVKTLYINMFGSAGGAEQVNPIYVTIDGVGNDNISFLGTIGTDLQDAMAEPVAYQITSTNEVGGLTIFSTDGPTDTLTYNAGTGSNEISLQNQIVSPGVTTFNSLAGSSGTDSYTVTAVQGAATINQDGKDLAVLLGTPVETNAPFPEMAGLDAFDGPVSIGGAVADSSRPTGYDGTVALTVNDAVDLTPGTGAIDDGSISGFDLPEGNTISWAYITSLGVTLGNFGNHATVDLNTPTSVTIQAGNGGDYINAEASSIPMTLLGGSGADSILASNNGDYIDGGAGNDFISEGVGSAHGGSDTIIGGDGSNTIIDDGAVGLIYGNDPTDDGATGSNLITGTAAGLIYTGPGQDTVDMTGGNSVTVYAGGGERFDYRGRGE